MTDFVVSARKYRPKNFDEVVGQDTITLTLKNAIENNNLAQSFLFCGPRGVGKTTCARILAKQINEFNNDREDFSFNIFELDAASNNSVDDIRSLVEQVRVPPQVGKYKVYIIDEAHMLSSQAFNAFLKTLEEPPEHAKFILATTEKHKIIPTILSRCQIFDFKRVSIKDICNHLSFVSKKEGVNAEEEALHLISQKSDGSIRDALSLFDRLASFSQKELTYKSTITNLNILDEDSYFEIVTSLLSNDITTLLNQFNLILENGFDGHHFINGLAQHLRDLLVAKDEGTLKLLEKSEISKQRYQEQSQECDIKFLIQALELCNECDVAYKSTHNKRLLVELCLMRISSINLLGDKKKNNKNFVVNQQEKVLDSKNNDEKITIDNSEKKINRDILDEKSKYNDQISEELEIVEKSINSSFLNIHDDKIKESKTISISSSLKAKVEDKEKLLQNLEANTVFSYNKFQKVWSDLLADVKIKGQTNLYIILSSHKPEIKDKFNILLPINNSSQIEIYRENEMKVLSFLRKRLENGSVNIVLEVINEVEKMKPYTNQDKFQAMIKENPQLNSLRLKLGLDPDY